MTAAAAAVHCRSPTLPDAAWIHELYSHEQDAAVITAAASAAFLSQLAVQQQQLQQLQEQLLPGAKTLVNGRTPTADAANRSAASSNSRPIDVAPFVRVATDVLSYLRFCRSNALLQLLREFSATGQLDLQTVDPDELQSEVFKLLNLKNLNRWYLASGRSDGVGRSAEGGDGLATASRTAVQVGGVRHKNSLNSSIQHQQRQQQQQIKAARTELLGQPCR
jgi:hypothetical protein